MSKRLRNSKPCITGIIGLACFTLLSGTVNSQEQFIDSLIIDGEGEADVLLEHCHEHEPGVEHCGDHSVDSLDSFLSQEPAFAAAINADTVLESLTALNDHIAGDNILSASELMDIGLVFSNEDISLALRGDVSLMEQAYNTIVLHDDSQGALFTDGGVKSFATQHSTTDGNSLSRAMHALYLAVFDAIDENMIAANPQLIDGLAFASSSYFPGQIQSSAAKNDVYTVTINASVPEDWGRPNLYSQLSARRPTGTYLAPGSIAQITVPQALVDSGYQVRVGAHSWDLSRKNVQKRLARATKLYPITSTVTQVANPLGGNIYIEAPYLSDAGMVEVSISNVVESPYFSARSVDLITSAQWQNTERAAPGPWTDIETDRVMMSVPSKWIRNFSHAEMMDILNEYDTHMDLISDYMGKPHVRNKPSMFMQVDVIMRGGAFYPGYPMGNYPSFNSETPRAPLVSGHAFDQIFLHEHGHATYVTKFTTRERESIVHMLYPYIGTQLYEMPLEEAFSNSLGYAKSTERTMDDVFVSWALRDGFINDIDMSYPNAAYKHRGHADYIQYVDLFGWTALTEVNRKLNVDYVETGYDFHRNEHENNDRILRFSREAGVDVRPLFHLWGHSPNNEAALQAALDAENLRPSSAIYDAMTAFKSTIPFTQADYNAWYDRMKAVLFAGHRTEFWDPLAASYDLDRATAAVDRVDQLLAEYFPNGRPALAPVTLYADQNYEGTSWSVTTGTYNIDNIRASVIGSDNVSSIQIAPDHEVTVCQHNNLNGVVNIGGGQCVTYTESVAALGTLNNQASYISVVEVPESLDISQFPKDLQLYPRDPQSATAPVVVSGALSADEQSTTLNVYREDILWNTWTHNRIDSSSFRFALALPAELANYRFELRVTDNSDVQSTVATANSVVAGDVFVINGQSNAASGLYSLSDSSTEDTRNFVRSYGGWAPDTWNTNDAWHIVRAECRPFSQPTACIGRWPLRFAADLVDNNQVPVAVINQARGGVAIEYFQPNESNFNDLETNYGRLLTRLQNGGLDQNIRGFLWYQGESDRLQNQAHFEQFPEVFGHWQNQYPSVEQYYVFQIRHTCVLNDDEFGQGAQISDWQRQFAEANNNVTAVSTTGIDGHDGCHFRYVDGYQQMGDNIARIVRSELYGEDLSDADASQVINAVRVDETTVGLAFTPDNTMVGEAGFEALFQLADNNNNPYSIVEGAVQSDSTVLLTVDTPLPANVPLQLDYISLSGEQNWLTNAAGIGILSFLDIPVAALGTPLVPAEPVAPAQPETPTEPQEPAEPQEPSEPQEPAEPQAPVLSYGVDTDLDGVPDSIEIAEGTDPADAVSFKDSDADGGPDFTDTDSDGDGEWNLHEPGAFPYYDRDGDAVPAYLDDNDYDQQIGNDDNAVEALFDTDNTSVADFLEASVNLTDTDGDGVPDVVENADGTGSEDAEAYLDFDSDGMPDYLDTDDDNDGIADVYEGSNDLDNDGVANQFDTDSDGDGVIDSEEGIADIDGNAIPNFLDPETTSSVANPDQDNDGIADSVEGNDDADQDGVSNLQDNDSDGDGLSDLVETNADIDADGVPNFLDDDSDGDGLSDQFEGMSDIDNDTLGNAIDHDSDADTIPDGIELADDTDADGIPNFIDTDSDGDGIADIVESVADADNDGVADYLDNDEQASPAAKFITGTGCALHSVGLRTADPTLPLILLFIVSAMYIRWRPACAASRTSETTELQ